MTTTEEQLAAAQLELAEARERAEQAEQREAAARSALHPQHGFRPETIRVWDFGYALLYILLIFLVCWIFTGLELTQFYKAGFVGSVKLLAIPLLGAVFIFAAVIAIRSFENDKAEHWGIFLTILGSLVAAAGFVMIPLSIHKGAANPSVEVNRGGEMWEEITVKKMELPPGTKAVRIFTQAIREIPVSELEIAADGTILFLCVENGVTTKVPLTIQVPKGSHGEVYFQPDDQPKSLASSY